jgi:predicted PurR-regulated permease PerM
MTFLDSHRDRAAVLLVLLGAVLIWALMPFATGLIGIPVLYVIFRPVHDRLTRRVGRPISAGLVVALALLLIVTIGVAFTGLVVTQLQDIVGGLKGSPTLARLGALRIGGIAVGPALADAGTSILGWAGGSALSVLGSATRQALNMTIALFGFYYLLLKPGEVWTGFSSYLPFSAATTVKLQDGFRNVTTSTIIGTGLVALLQGTLVGLAFWAAGFSNALFWAVVTVVLSILPVVGSGLVWGPAVVALVLDQRYGWAVALAAWGILVVGNVELVIRPLVFRRFAQIHPLITLVGAFAAVPYFGLLGLLIGPLALSYFFEILKAYREEYAAAPAEPAVGR